MVSHISFQSEFLLTRCLTFRRLTPRQTSQVVPGFKTDILLPEVDLADLVVCDMRICTITQHTWNLLIWTI